MERVYQYLGGGSEVRVDAVPMSPTGAAFMLHVRVGQHDTAVRLDPADAELLGHELYHAARRERARGRVESRAGKLAEASGRLLHELAATHGPDDTSALPVQQAALEVERLARELATLAGS